MATEIVLKKWGNSLGGIFPRDFVKKNRLSENDRVFVNIVKPVDLSKAFGRIQRALSGQAFKDEARKGWS